MPTPAQTLEGLKHFQLAQQAGARGDIKGALAGFTRAYKLLPNHPDLLQAFADLAERAQDWRTAEILLRQLHALRPQDSLLLRHAYALFQLDQLDPAIDTLRALLARQPAQPDALRMLGLILTRQCRWEAAIEAGEQLNAVAPSSTAMDIVLHALFHLGRWQELDAYVDQAMALYPDELLVMSVCVHHLIKRGDYARGFAWPHAVRARHNQGIRSANQAPPHWWDGKPFDGLLLVSGKQGIGDEIIAANMFRDLEAFRHTHGQDILVECDARLLPLFRRSFPALVFAARAEDESLTASAGGRDFRMIKSLDLTYHFRRQTPLPPQQPWLVPDAHRVGALRAAYRERFADMTLAGLSWKSSRAPLGANKSMRMTDLAPLLAMPGHTWINLQYGDIDADLAEASAAGLPMPFVDPAVDPMRDIDGLIAQIAALDVVVSTSSTTAHLAGAIGSPGHILLPKSQAVFWYWGYTGERTPWYPSLRLHRNRNENDWQALATDVAATLRSPPA